MLAQRKKRYLEKREQIRALAIAGVSYKTIQAALGVAHGTIYLWLAELGILARKRGPNTKREKTLPNA